MKSASEAKCRAVYLSDIAYTVITPNGYDSAAFVVDAEWWGVAGTDIAIPFVSFGFENGRLNQDETVGGRMVANGQLVDVFVSLKTVQGYHRAVIDGLSPIASKEDDDERTVLHNEREYRAFVMLCRILLSVAMFLLVFWLLIKS